MDGEYLISTLFFLQISHSENLFGEISRTKFSLGITFGSSTQKYFLGYSLCKIFLSANF